MKNSEIIGVVQEDGASCAEEKCKDTKCYFYAEPYGCMTDGPCVYEPDEYELEQMRRQCASNL